MPLALFKDSLISVFEQWGKPGSMRVDNGEPLGSPANDTTTPMSLWLIGHDIDMIWNKPRTPQLNGVVEHLQDTSQRWAEIDKARDIKDLQKRLDAEALVQRAEFKVSRLKFQTRLKVYPELLSAQRNWSPEGSNHFEEKRVYEFLEKKVYTRKVSKNGQIAQYKQKYKVDKSLAGQFVQVKFDKNNLAWLVYDNYKLVGSFPCPNLDKYNILNLSVMSMNIITESS